MPRAKQPVDDDFLDDSDSELDSIDERDLADATLPEPHAVQIKVSVIHKRYRNGLIELNPYYQREVVWPVHRQSGLINSIFNNYYIPPVIFQVLKVYNQERPDARPTIYQTVIDGKQRLSSIVEFMAGRIPYRDPRGAQWWYPVVEAKKRKGKLLTKELKERFDNWSLLCIEYEGLNQQQEEDLFARVQQGMALSNNEKHMASHTPWIRLIKEIMKTNKAVTELCVDLRRGKDFGNVANVVVTTFYSDMRKANEPLNLRVTQASLSKVVNKMDHGPPSAKFSDRMRLLFKVWTDLCKASPETFSNEFTSQILRNFAPIEFLAVGVLLHIHMDNRDNETLIGDIAAMRKYIRTGGKALDLRTNTNTWRWFWTFISELEAHRGTSKRPTPASRIVPPALPMDVHGSTPAILRQNLVLSTGAVAPSSSNTAAPKRGVRKVTKIVKPSEKVVEPEPEPAAEEPRSSTRQRPIVEIDTTQASARKRKVAALLDDDSEEEEAPRTATKRKSLNSARKSEGEAARGKQQPVAASDEDEDADDEIFQPRATKSATPAQTPVPPSNNMVMQNSMPQNGMMSQNTPMAMIPPEMMAMFAAQLTAYQQQQQQQQQQQMSQNQNQGYQNGTPMGPQFQYAMPNFANMQQQNGTPQQWQMPQQQFVQQQQQQAQPSTPMSQESDPAGSGSVRPSKRRGGLKIDL